jgi:transcriptional regulator of met regulon
MNQWKRNFLSSFRHFEHTENKLGKIKDSSPLRVLKLIKFMICGFSVL